MFERTDDSARDGARSTASCARSSPTWSRASPTGFERKLELIGIGYRAEVKGKKLNLALGFSHPIVVPAARRASRRKVDKNTSSS